MPGAIETIGEAHDQGWRLVVRCAEGRGDGMKRIPICKSSVTIDLATLVWTRGRAFPLDRLSSCMRCIACGSRRVRVLIAAPSGADAARARMTVER